MKINHEIRDKAALDNAIALREIADRMLSEAMGLPDAWASCAPTETPSLRRSRKRS